MAADFIYGLSADPDTIYLYESLASEDREDSIEKEVDDHILRNHCKFVPLSSIPPNQSCLSMVWSMKHKRNPLEEITCYKARLCSSGHKSIEFIDYWNAYSPVVAWQTVRTVFTLAITNGWHTRSVDFVLAFPQAEINTWHLSQTTTSSIINMNL